MHEASESALMDLLGRYLRGETLSDETEPGDVEWSGGRIARVIGEMPGKLPEPLVDLADAMADDHNINQMHSAADIAYLLNKHDGGFCGFWERHEANSGEDDNEDEDDDEEATCPECGDYLDQCMCEDLD